MGDVQVPVYSGKLVRQTKYERLQNGNDRQYEYVEPNYAAFGLMHGKVRDCSKRYNAQLDDIKPRNRASGCLRQRLYLLWTIQ